MRNNKTIQAASALLCLSATVGTASAAITIHGSSTAYTETGGDWLSMGTNDIDVSGGLGTDGHVFFGVFDGNNTSGANGGSHDYATGTVSAVFPSYVTANSAGANFTTIADEFVGYGSIDNPNLLNGTDTLGGFALGIGGAAGTNKELIDFTIAGLGIGQTVRIGVYAGAIAPDANGRWDPTSITLSDGTSTATVGNHTTSALSIAGGWVFFDVDTNGDYVASATKRLSTQGAAIAGLTFDSITVPEPSSALLLSLAGLAACGTRRRKA